MISAPYSTMCTGWPTPRLAAKLCSQARLSFVPNQLAIVAGKSSRLEAKIGGITPDMLSLNGRCVVVPAIIRRPCWRLA